MGKRIALLLLVLPTLVAVEPHVDAGAPSVERLKAAFVYKFTLLVTWPEQAFDTPETPLSLCVLGDDPFDGELEEALKGRKSKGRTLALRRLEDPGQARSCHVLYIPASEASRVRAGLATVAGAPTLTIGETEKFSDLGGVIYLEQSAGRIRFEINRGSARRAGLEISSKLLQVARAVYD